jgi:hypothetical protein
LHKDGETEAQSRGSCCAVEILISIREIRA